MYPAEWEEGAGWGESAGWGEGAGWEEVVGWGSPEVRRLVEEEELLEAILGGGWEGERRGVDSRAGEWTRHPDPRHPV